MCSSIPLVISFIVTAGIHINTLGMNWVELIASSTDSGWLLLPVRWVRKIFNQKSYGLMAIPPGLVHVSPGENNRLSNIPCK